MSLYSDILPPGFEKPVTLDNLVEVLDKLRHRGDISAEAIETLQQAVDALQSEMGAALSTGIPVGILGVTLDHYDETFFLNEKTELSVKLVQFQHWAATRQREARFQQSAGVVL